MNIPPESKFEGARLKVERACCHIQELESVFNTFLQSDFCQLVVEKEPGTDNQLVKLVSIGAPPPKAALIIGDALHNLRAALDHVIVQILGKGGDKGAFPMAKDRNNPGSSPAYGLIKKTLPDLAALLIDKIGIHDTGDACLWAISKLDNIDKHNLLITVTSVQQLRGVSLQDKANGNRFDIGAMTVGEGKVLHVISYGAGTLEITNKGQAAAQIVFGKDLPLAGQPVLESLTKLAQLTLQTIEKLETFWFQEQSKRNP